VPEFQVFLFASYPQNVELTDVASYRLAVYNCPDDSSLKDHPVKSRMMRSLFTFIDIFIFDRYWKFSTGVRACGEFQKHYNNKRIHAY